MRERIEKPQRGNKTIYRGFVKKVQRTTPRLRLGFVRDLGMRELVFFAFFSRLRPQEIMNIDSLRIFCDVVQHKSFSRGAAINDISQAAATQSVLRMERLLGVSLIDRSKRPFVLTREGELCNQGFREIIEKYDTVITQVRSLRDSMSGIIRIAAIYSVGLHVMSRCMSDFMKTYPKSKVRLEFQHPQKVLKAVNDGEVDFGIISYPHETQDINVIPLRSESMVLACFPDHPLSGKKEISFEYLQQEDFIAFDRDLMIRKEIDQQMKNMGIRINVVMEFDNIETIKQAVESGLGVSVLPSPSVKKEAERGEIVAIPISKPKIMRPIGIIYKTRKVLSPIMKKFIEVLIARQEE